MPPLKIVYLFGAGSTIGETQYADMSEEPSLIHISEEVIRKAKTGELSVELQDIAEDDIADIEHYISLLESVRTKKYTDIASKLRHLFCTNIQDSLTIDGQPIQPVLGNALLQMHQAISDKEKFTGAISLNYDNMMDRASNEILGGVNYGLNCKCQDAPYVLRKDIPTLIKLHGSFNWKSSIHSVVIDESAEQEKMLWIPPSIQKDRGTYPFNILWGKAFEMLDCDILRIIGCSLSQNDWGLISLLYCTQLEATNPYEIQLICSHQRGKGIRERYGFLKKVRILGELENCQIFSEYKPKNTFQEWLIAKLNSFKEEGIEIGEMNYNYINKLLGVV